MSTVVEYITSGLKALSQDELKLIRNHIAILLSDENLDEAAFYKLETEGLIPAVKMVKERTGWGLKEAKEYVDKIKAASKKGIPFERIK